jgi:hypothetical protein
MKEGVAMMVTGIPVNRSSAFSKSSLIALIIMASLLLVIQIIVAAETVIFGASIPEAVSRSEDRQAVDLQTNLSPDGDLDLYRPEAPGILPSRFQAVRPGSSAENVMRLIKGEG